MLAVLAASLMLLSAQPSGGQAAEQPAATAVGDGATFHVDLPAGATLTRRIVIDFALYQLEIDGHPVMGFYEGFAADVDDWVTDRHKRGRQERRVEGRPMEYFWNVQCSGHEVHGWIYPDLSEADLARARRIADSLRMGACGGG